MITCTDEHRRLFKKWSGWELDQVIQMDEEARESIRIKYVQDHMAEKNEDLVCLTEDLMMFLDFGTLQIGSPEEDAENEADFQRWLLEQGDET